MVNSSEEVEDYGGLFGKEEQVTCGITGPAEKLFDYKLPSTGEKLIVRVVNHHVLWAHFLWNGAYWMSDYIDANPKEFSGRRIVELGAGAGLPSILATRANAKKVVVTDYPDKELIENLEKNIEGLLRDGEEKGRIVARGFLWGSDVAPLIFENDGKLFDIIIMCDVIFNHSEHGKLLSSVKGLLEPNGGTVWCVFSHYRPWYTDRDLALLEMAREEYNFKTELFGVYKCDEIIKDDRADSDSLRTVYAYRLYL